VQAAIDAYDAERKEFMSIPKIIHYCWFGGGEIPERDKRCIESWKKYCPDYEIIQWNEENYDVTQIPYMQEAYKAKRWGFVADFVRMDLLYRYGGIYMDTDVELIRPLDDFLEYRAYAGLEAESNCVAFGLGFGAEKGSAILKEFCDYYRTLRFRNDDGTLNLTPNPIIITEYLAGIGYECTPGKIGSIKEFTIFPEEYFCPQVFSTGKVKITDKTYSIHHYHASWQTEEEKQAVKAYRCCTKIFGERLGNLLYQTTKTLCEDGVIATIQKIISHCKR
jgi:hypothetical protein